MRATHRGIHPLLALFTALLALALFTTPTIATPGTQSGESTTKVLLTRGHADVFALVPNGPTISLVAKEDVTTPVAPNADERQRRMRPGPETSSMTRRIAVGRRGARAFESQPGHRSAGFSDWGSA